MNRLAALLAPAALLLVACTGTPEPAPTVTKTVTAEPEPADLPTECVEAFAEAEGLLTLAVSTADNWQRYATGPVVGLLNGSTTPDEALAAHSEAVEQQTTMTNRLSTSNYAELRAACLTG